MTWSLSQVTTNGNILSVNWVYGVYSLKVDPVGRVAYFLMGTFPNAGSVAIILNSCTVSCSELFRTMTLNGAWVQLNRTKISTNICIYRTKRLQEYLKKITILWKGVVTFKQGYQWQHLNLCRNFIISHATMWNFHNLICKFLKENGMSIN